MGMHVTGASCPKCGQRVQLTWGKEQSCPACGERLAACGYCGKPLTGAAVAHQDARGREWLCEEHAAWEAWEAARLREFASPEANQPPPDSSRAVAARREYEERVRDVVAQGRYVLDELFPYGSELEMGDPPGASPELPAEVVDAYSYYEKAVMEQDFGSVRVHRWELEGTPLYLVRCTTDGSDGWLELYDADGTPLGDARTDWDCPVWKPRGVVRRSAFAEDSPELRQELAAAVQRLRGR